MSFEVITKLRFNKEEATYSIVQAMIKYTFPESLLADFKEYIIQRHLISGWYELHKDKVSKSRLYD